MLILILKIKVLIFAIKKIDITIIDTNIYYIVYKLKRFPVFIIFMKDLLSKKKIRLKINQRNIILKEYHNFLNLFFEKNLNTFLPYQKYNYEIILKKE